MERKKFIVPEGHILFVQTGEDTFDRWVMQDGCLVALDREE